MENIPEQKIRRRIVLTDSQISPILELLQNDEDFKRFKRAVVINDFLLAVENSVREYISRQKQEMQALSAIPEPTFQEANPDLVAQYEQQIGQRLQRRDRSYAQQYQAQPQPQYQPQMQQQVSMQPQYQPQPQPFPASVRPTAPPETAPLNAKQPETESDDINFANFDDTDF